MDCSSTSINSPAYSVSGYPSGTMYLQTLALGSNSTLSSVPSTIALQTSTYGVLSKGNTFIASGSPNLALYSMSFGPSDVSMNWP